VACAVIVAGDIFGDIVSTLGNVLSGAASGVAAGIISVFAHAVLGSLTRAIEWLSTVWMNTPTPTLVDASGTASGTVAWMQGELLPLTAALAVGSIIVGGAKIAVAERGHAEAREFTRWLFVYALASAGGVAFAAMLISTCDGFATYIIAGATTGSNFGDHLAQALGLATQAIGSGTLQPQGGFLLGLAGTGASAMLAILIGAIALVASFVEFVLMAFRGGVLVILCGLIPLAAAFSNIPTGGALAASDRWVDRCARAVQAGGGVLLRGGVSALGRHRRDRGDGRSGAAGRIGPGAAGALAADAARGRALHASPGSGGYDQDGDRRDADRRDQPCGVRRRGQCSHGGGRGRAAARRRGRPTGWSGRSVRGWSSWERA